MELRHWDRRPLVLIVDDTPANLRLLADLLKEGGCEVRVAPSGQLALDLAARHLPDLILLDIAMPGMDGFEVCRRLKADPACRSVPVIFISASTEEEDKVRCFREGGVDYVTKPFQSAEVEARVEAHLSLYRYRQHLEQLVERKVREVAATLDRAARAEKAAMLGLLSAGIAHEINQPLNVLKMRADSLLYWAGQGSPAPLDELLRDVETISRCAGQIGDIIHHMRALAREQKPDRTEPCSLPAAVRNALLLAGSRLAAHGVEVGVDVCGPAAEVRMSPVHAEQILVNLLANALQALDRIDRPDKRVDVRVRPGVRTVTLEVADNGPGIPEADRERIFEPFFSTGSAGENMGLGLSILKQIVQSYGGSIRAEGNPAGGASILVELPADQPENGGGEDGT